MRAWATAGREGEGVIAPWKYCDVFCALTVTAKTCFEACFEGHFPRPANVVFCALIVIQ